MVYSEGEEAQDDGPQARTAFREAEKKYQLFRERVMKIKGGRRKAGKLITRPIDMSEVFDLQSGAGKEALPEGVVRHNVPGPSGPAYTFVRHPGLVFLPGALPAAAAAELTQAALTDYPEPPARTNHTLQYGHIPGLWEAAQRGLRLKWKRQDDPHAGPSRRVGCEHRPPKPHLLPDAEAGAGEQPQSQGCGGEGCCGGGGGGSGSSEAAGCVAAHVAGSAVVQGGSRGDASAEPSSTHPQSSCSDLQGGDAPGTEAMVVADYAAATGQSAAGPAGADPLCCGGGAVSQASAAGVGAPAALGCREPALDQSEQRQPCLERRGGCAAASSCGAATSARSAGCDTAQRCAAAGGGGGGCGGPSSCGRSLEECWSVDGAGPPAEQLLRKLRWATLGPQFDWTQRQYDFRGPYRQLPPILGSLALQMAGIMDSLQASGQLGLSPTSVSKAYRPDAAIVNYYQEGDMLGGHLDDVERDMGQPIVSLSLGCPAIFLMGGTSKDVPPTALLLRGGDVLVLSGEARRCYHGVPRILEMGGLEALDGQVPALSPVEAYMRCARINISIRAVR